MEVQEFKDTVMKMIVTRFKEDKEILPLLMLVTDAEIKIIPTPARSQSQKELLTESIIPALIKRHDALMMSTVNSGWMRTANAQKPVDLSVPVRDHPDKMEVIMATIESRDTKSQLVVWKVIRPKHKDPYLELVPEIDGGGESVGRYSNLLRRSLRA
eukprot:Filipodium_phascolosomae@DN7952_c0_g1_i1.p1